MGRFHSFPVNSFNNKKHKSYTPPLPWGDELIISQTKLWTWNPDVTTGIHQTYPIPDVAKRGNEFFNPKFKNFNVSLLKTWYIIYLGNSYNSWMIRGFGGRFPYYSPPFQVTNRRRMVAVICPRIYASTLRLKVCEYKFPLMSQEFSKWLVNGL